MVISISVKYLKKGDHIKIKVQGEEPHTWFFEGVDKLSGFFIIRTHHGPYLQNPHFIEFMDKE